MDQNKDLGRLVAVHGMAPAHLQRAVFIIVLSFVFFLAMMFAYYIRQSIVYFLLASAFLLLYLITMISFAMHRRSVVQVFENGISYKSRQIEWSDITAVDDDGTLTLANSRTLVLPKMVVNSDQMIGMIRARSAKAAD